MHEVILTESASLRNSLCTEKNTTVLNRVGELQTLPKTGWATTDSVAKFYDVAKNTIEQIVKRHRQEVHEDGYRVLSRKEAERLQIPPAWIGNRGLAVFSRRAVLRVGMLLSSSEVAITIRTYLLNQEDVDTPALKNQIREQGKVLVSHAYQLTHHAGHFKTQAKELKEHAHQLSGHAHQLTEHASQLQCNADQLVAHSKIVQAMVGEISRNRQQIEHNSERIQKLEEKYQKVEELEEQIHFHGRRIVETEQLLFSFLEGEQLTLNSKQILLLRQKAKQFEKPKLLWKKFREKFRVRSYHHLPQKQLMEAIHWIDNSNIPRKKLLLTDLAVNKK